MAQPTIEILPLDRFRPQAANANAHTARGEGALRDSIQSDGFIDAATVAADGEHISGSSRYEQALATGFDAAIVVDSDGTRPVIVRRVDIPTATDPRAKRLAVAANRVAELNLAWDSETLAALQAEDAALLAGLFRDDELAGLLPEATPTPGAGGDEFDATPQEGPTRTSVGDVWALGAHRLAVGDSTDPAVVARLMDGQRAHCMWTDPPYGVSYTGKTKDALTLENDDADGLGALLAGAFAVADSVLAEGAALYVAHPAGALSVTFGVCFLAQGWRLHETLVWVKDSMVLGHSDYHYKHEPILFGYTPAKGRRGRGGEGWYGDNSQVSVFEVDRPKASPDHPTGKPVALIMPMLQNSCPRGGLVYEPFAGSGSTLIAAHRTGRICYGCELSPQYADVILRRAEAEGIGPIVRLAPES